ncbi:hypothetical protein H4R18_003360 [Coemansia javaensis]|uniref:WW domain-containing protein n=1 Tax=Coemansia javaensis TaxID=2761396 RepID=A0A9W8LIP9_9FUNG|nr:hypothetical protein H4R18_003360 [Coemansia javaensis]
MSQAVLPQLPPEALAGSGHDWAVFLAPADARGRSFVPREPYYYERNNGITTWIRPFDYVEPADHPLAVGERWQQEEAEHRRRQARARAKQDRPVAQTQAGATSWWTVTTAQGRTYYHNTETGASQWDQPEEAAQALADAAEKAANQDEAPAGTEMTADDAEWMLAQMADSGSEDGGDVDSPGDTAALTESADLPKSERVAQFKEMLREARLDPFGSWEMQKSRHESDPRFAAIGDDDERQDLFNEACRELMEQRRRERPAAAAPADPDPFGQLLREKATKRMSFARFCQRNLKDPRYLAVKTSRERERRFAQHMGSLP